MSFVIILGILVYCSVKYHVKLNQYRIIIYNVFGKKVKIDKIGINFKTYQVARNYILEYQKNNFSP